MNEPLVDYRVVITHDSEICVRVKAHPNATKEFLREMVLCMADDGEVEWDTVSGDTDFYVIGEGSDDTDHGCYIHDPGPRIRMKDSA
jgi:hypothetical protein